MIDPKTGAVVGVGYAHHEIHEGSSFKVCDVQNINTTTQKWIVTTPDSKTYAHMLFDAFCTGEMSVLVTEGADRTGTTVLTPLNRRRVGTPPAATVIVHRDVSGGATDGAIELEKVRVGATDKFSAAISEHRDQNEYVLKPNTKYVMAVTTYADVNVSLHLDWYEHKDAEWSDRVKE